MCRVKQLVCAPSNTACDVITKRLLKHIPKDAKLLRMYAMNISFGKICEEFKTDRIINMEGGEVYMPTKEEIMSKDIVVCTSTTAGRFVVFISCFNLKGRPCFLHLGIRVLHTSL